MSLSERLLPAARPRFDGHWVSVENSLHILEGDSLLFLLDTSHRALCIHIIPVANIYVSLWKGLLACQPQRDGTIFYGWLFHHELTHELACSCLVRRQPIPSLSPANTRL